MQVASDNAIDRFRQEAALLQLYPGCAINCFGRPETFEEFGSGARSDAGGHV